MKSKIAGVALAAVVGACAVGGVAERAEAAVLIDFTLFGSGDVSSGTFGYSVTGQFNSRTSGIEYSYNYENYSFITEDESFGSGGGYARATMSSYGYYSDPLFGNPLFQAYVSADDIGLGVVEYLRDDGSFSGFELSSGGYFKVDGFRSAMSGNFVQDLSITQISDVPLPAAAPLFGAALLALGGAGYANRRAKLIAT